MRLIFYLSGENECLARMEVLNLLNAREICSDRQILIAEIDKKEFKKINRLALTHEVSLLYSSCDLDSIDEVFREIPFENDCCIRVTKIGFRDVKSNELERRLGEIIWRRGARINLTNPRTVIRVYVSDRCHIGFLTHRTDKKQFLERHPDRRPFRLPCVILPRIGRAMVNIANGENLLDPMCGTGTFLIEAGLMGLNFVGVEAYKKIVSGCVRNLRFFGLPANVIWGDARELPFKEEVFGGVVTDFPYQRSTKLFGENLVERSLEEIYRVLKVYGRAVIVINRDIDDLIGDFFKIEEKCYQRVHKSLMRRFYVCIKER